MVAVLLVVAGLALLASCLLTFIAWQEYREMKLKSVRLRFGNGALGSGERRGSKKGVHKRNETR